MMIKVVESTVRASHDAPMSMSGLGGSCPNPFAPHSDANGYVSVTWGLAE